MTFALFSKHKISIPILQRYVTELNESFSKIDVYYFQLLLIDQNATLKTKSIISAYNVIDPIQWI